MSDEKTFAPTPRRREQARQDGHFPRGSDLTGISVVLTALAALLCCGPWWFHALGELWTSLLPDQAATSFTGEQAVAALRQTLWLAGKSTLPVMGLCLAVALVTQWAQVGWNWLPQRVMPDWDRVNLFDRMASPGQLFRWTDGLLVVLRYTVGLGVGIGALWALRETLGPTGDTQSTALMFGRAAQTGVAIVFHAGVGLAVVSIVEYGYRWWKFEAGLMMTATEARDDAREQEGGLRVRPLHRGLRQDSSIKQRVPTRDESPV